MKPLSPSHEIADHVSEVRLRVRAGSLGELLEEAGRAVAWLQLRGADVIPGNWRTIELSAPDPASLLVDWLNELIRLAQAEWWVGVDLEVASADDGQVCARAWGARIERTPGLLKIATPYGRCVNEVPGGLAGEVTLGT